MHISIGGLLDTLEKLNLVSRLLDQTLDLRMDAGSPVPIEHRPMFQPLVQATAWRETCWRHYVGTVDKPQVIRSRAGAIGMIGLGSERKFEKLLILFEGLPAANPPGCRQVRSQEDILSCLP